MNIQTTVQAAGKFIDLIDERPSVLPGVGAEPPSCRGELEMVGVSFSYPSSKGVVVLSNFDLHATAGSVVALVGSSGAGKSTVGRLIERFYDPQAGSLRLDGRDYRDLELRWLRRQVGYV